MSFLRPLWIALQLLTRLPTPNSGAPDASATGRSLLYYPLVGLLIGALLSAAGWSLAGHLPPMLLAAILLTLWVLITGALHLDGLADSADGWLGGYGDRERTLKIMHDPQSGPAAIVLLVLVLLLKFAALMAIVEMHRWDELWLAPLLARTLLPLLFLTTSCAQTQGMAASLAAYLPHRSTLLAVIIGLSTTALAAPAGPWMVLSGLVLFVLLRRMMMLRIGGMSGDTAGALVELTETAALIALVVAAFW